MRINLIYDENYSPEQDLVLDRVVIDLMDHGFLIEEFSFSGLPKPRRPRRPR